ncbi:hypothetical protein [Neorhizobium sp. LjRoot104]|uniref:hypothetical protein n=1 Tax=Neorhizobium sp. LjRoot104 TaxID=3342254 RepID=UPI003ECECAC2
MNYRKRLLTACAGIGFLAILGSLAMPFAAPNTDTATAGAVPAGYHDLDKEGENEGHRRHGDAHDRRASKNYLGDDDDDDDDGACGGRSGAMQHQKTATPANGLFTSGSTPRAQTN